MTTPLTQKNSTLFRLRKKLNSIQGMQNVPIAKYYSVADVFTSAVLSDLTSFLEYLPFLAPYFPS